MIKADPTWVIKFRERKLWSTYWNRSFCRVTLKSHDGGLKK